MIFFQTGFIKAFSASSQTFTYGFTKIERIMKTLFVPKLYLWPRFHLAVKSSLDKINVIFQNSIIIDCF